MGAIEQTVIGAPGSCEGFDEPESAEIERALLAAQPIIRVLNIVAVDEIIGDEAASLRGLQRCAQVLKVTRVTWRQEEHERHHQIGRVE